MSRTNLLPAVVAGALGLYALFFASSYDQRLLTLAGVYLILVLGYQFIFGHAGALSLAQGAFFGVGAYTTGILATSWNPGFFLTFPLSIALPTLLAATVAIPVLRLQTHYFALATLALSQLVLIVAINWEGVTGGANGLPAVPSVEILGWTAARGLPLLAVVWAIAALAILVARRQMNPVRTAAFTIARETPLAAPAYGMDPQIMRFRAFLLSAAFGGAAGALFVHTNRVVSPEVLGFGVMITCLTMAVVGGRYTIAGALIGALLLTHLPEWLRAFDRYYLVAMGALLLAMVVFAPNGIAALLRRDHRNGTSVRHFTDIDADTFAGPAVDLTVENLSKRYGGVQALDDVSLHVGPGEILGIIGPNGAGKTTLANALTGTIDVDAGSIYLSGRDLTGAAAHDIARSGIARTFQTPQVPADLTIVQIVETAISTMGADDGPDRETALVFCGLVDHADTEAGKLPHGIRRRVEICRAISIQPGVLVLDEPAAGLTPQEQAEIATLCTSLSAAGMTIIVIDHNVGFLQPMVSRLVCLDAGRVIADGPPDRTLADPRVRDAYFGLDIK